MEIYNEKWCYIVYSGDLPIKSQKNVESIPLKLYARSEDTPCEGFVTN